MCSYRQYTSSLNYNNYPDVITIFSVLICTFLSQGGSSFVIRNYRPTHNYQTLYDGRKIGYRCISWLEKCSIASSSSLLRAADDKTDGSSTSTMAPYPTDRGSEVDSRKIIAAANNQQYITAIRIKHILLATQDLADLCVTQIRASQANFIDLAKQLSICKVTREKGGEIGWINIKPSYVEQQSESKASSLNDISDTNEHLNTIIPKDARDLVFQITTKPGDVCTVHSTLGYHIVQIVDIMMDIRQMVFTRKRQNLQLPSKIKKNDRSQNDNGNNWFDSTHQLTYKMETMGCQMNVADSERIEGQLQSLGIRPYDVNEEEEETYKGIRLASKRSKKQKKPDIVILNTCSIRDHAEQKVYSYIGPYAKRKRSGDDVTIIVAGCVAQQEGKQLLSRIPEIDLVMGPQYANRISDLLEYSRIQGDQIVATDATHIMEDATKPRRQSTVSAWVNVIYGCNERCTFCIVPTTRGVEQSRPIESILDEVSDLVNNQGYKEITLLGQNIDAYGRDMIPKRKFSELLRAVGTIPGLRRLRFVTSHPRYMSMGVIDAVAETPSACESFNIPFQSGSNIVLNAMGRGYTREKYLRIVKRIRDKVPDASITADAIVGFPGETEHDFQETLSLMKEVLFDNVNIRAYSPRPNTPAATWENQIEEHIKQQRLQRCMELNKYHAKHRRSRMINRIVDVLIEERNVQNPSQVMGRTRHGYIVYVVGNITELRGQIVNVKIHKTETFHLVGTIVENQNKNDYIN